MSGPLTIARLGAQGDGVADTPAGPVHVPFTLPGERVNAAVRKERGELIAVLEASASRVVPPCRHFGTCGGCALQHLEDAGYREWKRAQVAAPLARAGIEAPVEQLVQVAPGTRRRAMFSARRTEAGMLLGFSMAHSHTLVDVEECPVLLPGIVSSLGSLRRVAAAVCATRDAFRLTVAATASGLDVAAFGGGTLDDAARRAAVSLALGERLARLSVDGEILVEPSRPVVMAGDVPVALPPGAFMQAVEAAEAEMATLAAGHLAGARRVVDLFSGWGAFALRLAKASEVHAVEADAATLAALDRAFRSAGPGLKRVTTERRDLIRRPLLARELAGFDGLVFDPPRAGAQDQARQIARSDVARLVAVSCNPVTLARDLAILTDGGYRVLRVVPVDQFLWSPHVEAVALLEKPRRRR